ncbi:MAG: hypothetical protein M3P70_01330 [Actinomycetota bacterium]|nr:hypothetical protein [Actinomycetota bacterium]
MKTHLYNLARTFDRFGLTGIIAAKITCAVGMQLGLILGLLGASGVALPFLDPVNRLLGPVSLPLFVVSLTLLALGAIRRGPVALALVLGGGLLLYAAVYTHDMNLPLYALAMAMLLAPFLAQPVWCHIRPLFTRASDARDVPGASGE